MKRLAQGVLTWLVVMFLAGPMLPVAFAAIKPAGAPTPPKPWLEWVITAVIVVGCGAVLFKNAKRSHQD